MARLLVRRLALLFILRGAAGLLHVSSAGDDSTGSGSASSPYATVARALLEPNRIAGELALSGTLRGEGNVNVTFTSMSTSIYSTADGATIDCESSSPGWTLLSGAYWVSGIAFRACDQAVRSHSAYSVLRECVFERNTRSRGLNGSALQVDSASAEAIECEFFENENPDGFGTIYIERGNLRLANASIHDNEACAGATIAVHAGSVQLHGVDARDNTRTDDGDCVAVLNPGDGAALLFSDTGTGASVAVAKTTGQLSAAALAENVACDVDSTASVVESDDGSSRVACVEEYEEPVDQLNCENFPDLCQGHPTSGTSSETKDEFPAYAIALMTLTVVCAVGAGFLFYLQGDAGGGHVEMMQGQPKRAAAPAPAEAPPTSGALV